MNFGTSNDAPCGEAESQRIVDAFVDAGHNCHRYGERLYGRGIRADHRPGGGRPASFGRDRDQMFQPEPTPQRNSQELKRSFMSSPLSDHHTQSLRSASFVFSGALGMWLAMGTPVARWWETSPSAE